MGVRAMLLTRYEGAVSSKRCPTGNVQAIRLNVSTPSSCGAGALATALGLCAISSAPAIACRSLLRTTDAPRWYRLAAGCSALGWLLLPAVATYLSTTVLQSFPSVYHDPSPWPRPPPCPAHTRFVDRRALATFSRHHRAQSDVDLLKRASYQDA